MSAFLNQQLTNVGWDALSVALGGGRLTFFKMQAGSGTIANDAAIPPMTALVSPVCDIAITSYVIEGDGQITLFGNIASSTLDVGFTFRELGVFATIEQPVAGKGGTPGGPNIQVITPPAAGTTANPVVPTPSPGTALMYSYCNSYASSDYIPGKNETTDVVNTVQVTVKIDKATNVVINIIAGGQMSVVNIGPASVGAGPWSYTQANVAYLKRLVPGAATLISEDTNTITIGAKQLTSDLDLYVANGNPDIAPNFSTIKNAIDYLGQYLIPTTIRARIHVQPGVYTMPGGPKSVHTYLNHPNAQNITIQGPQNTTVRGTTISITGSIKNWSAVIGGMSNTAQFAVNDWAIVDYCAGTTSANQALLCGFFKVTAKTASSVTLLIPYNKSSFPMTGFTAIDVTPISARLSCARDTNGFTTGAYGVGLFQYIGITAQATPSPQTSTAGVAVAGSGTLKYVGVAGFNLPTPDPAGQQGNGIISAGSAGAINCYSCAATDNMHGFLGGGGGSMNLSKCATSHNNTYGYWFDAGGSCAFVQGYSTTGGNGSYGLLITGGTYVINLNSIPVGYLYSHQNGNWGVFVVSRGQYNIATSCYLIASNNVNGDCYCDTFGMIIGSANIQGSRIFNLPLNQMSSSGGLIV